MKVLSVLLLLLGVWAKPQQTPVLQPSSSTDFLIDISPHFGVAESGLSQTSYDTHTEIYVRFAHLPRYTNPGAFHAEKYGPLIHVYYSTDNNPWTLNGFFAEVAKPFSSIEVLANLLSHDAAGENWDVLVTVHYS